MPKPTLIRRPRLAALTLGGALAMAALPAAAQQPQAPAEPAPETMPAPQCAPQHGGGHGSYHGRMHGAAMGKLTVSAQGVSLVAPDMAGITVGVTSQAATAAEAMNANATAQRAVIDAVRGAGIGDGDIQTSGLNLSPLMEYADGKAPSVTGYQAQNLVTIRVTDLAALGQVLDAAVAGGANEINGINFMRDDAQGAEDDARRDAVATARHRAEVLAEAAGMRLGPVLVIRDGAMQAPPMPMGMRAMDAKAEASIPVEAGRMDINAAVEMDFALLPQGEAGGAGAGGPECGPVMMPEGDGAAPNDAAPGAPAGAAPEAPAAEEPATDAPDSATPPADGEAPATNG